MRSWDAACLLRLDDPTLLELADLAARGVRLLLPVSIMAMQLPAAVSRYQLRLFLLCFYPERWQGIGSPGRPDQRHRLLNPGPAECQISYVMRTQGLTRRRAIAFIEDPAQAERAA